MAIPDGPTPDDVRPTLGSWAALVAKIGYTPTGAEQDRAVRWLGEASELIRDEAGKTWLNDAGTAVVDVPYRVRGICVDAAYRAFDNFRALTQRSVGDSAQTWDRNGVEGGSIVYLTDSEKQAVQRAAGGSSVSVVTLVSPYSGDEVVDSLLGY